MFFCERKGTMYKVLNVLFISQCNKPPMAKLFVVSNMSQLAQYVYSDYHCRMDALKAQRAEKVGAALRSVIWQLITVI